MCRADRARVRRLCRAALALAAAACALPAAAATPLEMPNPTREIAAPDVEQLRQTVTRFNDLIGGYPTRLASPAQREATYAAWSQALQQAWWLQAREPDSEDSLLLLSELYRQGHNMDVRGAGERADETVQRCIRLHPDSMGCHFSAAYFYLSIDPRFAAKGEASLHRLHAMYAPQLNAAVERGLVFAYLYQGRKGDARRQLDVVLGLQPDAPWALRMRDALDKGEPAVLPGR